MKKLSQKISIVAFLLLSFNFLSAQAPHKMSYQAVVRNSSFTLVVNSPIGMKVSILQGSATGTPVYVETQTATTNGNGLVTLQIGGGTLVSGSMATINWAAGPFFIKTETDPAGGVTYSIANTTQLLSVPYAEFAGNSATTAGNCFECHVHDKSSLGNTYSGSLAQKRTDNANSWPFSAHATGETAFGEGTNSGCAGCHADQGFSWRVANKLQPTYTGTAPGPYAYAFNVDASASSTMTALPGHIGCFTCHKGNPQDSFALVTTDSVKMMFYSMPGKEKYVNLTQDKKSSNICIMCHQSRPISQNTTSGDGSAVDYPALATSLTTLFYDSTKTASTGNKVSLSSSTVGHYGWPGNVLAGKGFGPIEIPGAPTAYTNSAHTTVAACADCHMASPKIVSGVPVGGHTFKAAGNYNGCNTTTCHGTSGVLSATSVKVTTAVNGQKAKLDQLAGLLKSKGQYMMFIDTTLATDGITRNNLWYKFTTLHFNGNINIGSAAGQFAVNTATPATGLYKFPTLTNGQFAAMQAFSVCIREFSGGIHNTQYTNALLSNAIWYLTNNPIQ